MKKILILLLVVVLLVGCGGSDKVVWEDLTVEEVFIQAAEHERYELEKITENDNNYRAILKADLMSSKTARKELLNKTKSIMKKVLEGNSDIEYINIEWQVELTDKAGNSEYASVIRIDLTGETIEKINWDKFDFNNFPDVADDYWEHQAIK